MDKAALVAVLQEAFGFCGVAGRANNAYANSDNPTMTTLSGAFDLTEVADVVFKAMAPETPAQMLMLLGLWHTIHEGRPGSVQQTTMTSLYSAIRDFIGPYHGGNYRAVPVDYVRRSIERDFPGIQEAVYAANSARWGIERAVEDHSLSNLIA